MDNVARPEAGLLGLIAAFASPGGCRKFLTLFESPRRLSADLARICIKMPPLCHSYVFRVVASACFP